jgi:hypothetical protein
VVSPRVREDSVHPRLQSSGIRRPLNFTVRSRAVTQPYVQTLSKTANVVVGVVVFTLGLMTALLAVALLAGVVRNPRGASWIFVLVMGMFAVFAAVLCTAGYRLLFRTADGAGSMLPRALWFVLCVVLGALAMIVLVVPLFLKQFNASLLYSSLMMAGFSWWCYRFARRGGNDIREGAASNNRWRGP